METHEGNGGDRQGGAAAYQKSVIKTNNHRSTTEAITGHK